MIWKDIESYEGLYQISETGIVRSLDHEVYQKSKHGSLMKRLYKGKIITPRIGKFGYLYLGLSKNGNKKSFKIHRLVAKAFVDGFEEDLQVNHKDGNKLNNHKDNLEWVTVQENLKHSRDTGLKPLNAFGENSPNCKGCIDVFLNGTLITTLCGTREIREFGLNTSCVSAVILGRSKHHKGYTFIRNNKV